MTITIERTEPTIQIIDLPAMGRAARLASRQLALLSSAAKNAALVTIADELEAQAEYVMAQNAQDIADARQRPE
ncbi:MAG: hypothetical protein R2873_15575 [Caldilineaceae bacterium]